MTISCGYHPVGTEAGDVGLSTPVVGLMVYIDIVDWLSWSGAGFAT